MNELKVGFLTVLAIVSLVVVSMTITANKSGFGTYVEYKTILKDATGIYEKSSIKVAGIVAGRIKKIELSGSEALITFEVLEQIKMTKNSSLRIKSVGFLGDKYIDIFLGDQNAQRLPAGSMVGSSGGEGFEALGKDAGEILKDVKVIAKAIKDAMYDDDKNNVVKDIIGNVRVFSNDVKRISASLRKLVTGNEEKLSRTLDNLNKIAAQIARETDRDAENSIMNDLSKLNPIMANMDKAVADIQDIVADVKSGKGTVGKLLRDEEVIDKVNETLSGVNRIVNRVTNFKADISLYAGAAFDEGSRTELNVDLVPSAERFFRVGLISTDFGREVLEKERVVTTTSGGSTTQSTQTYTETDYKFNAQIGRRINNWAFRVGLIDSTGGVGIDYNLYHYGFGTTLEAYDFDKDLGAAVRFAMEYRIWNVFYGRFTAEDVLSKEDDQDYTLAAGLKFTDEDLAALFGLAL
ncbi:MAG: MlaD family protein [Bacteriovoracaceae bacterium]|jgi:phospholipid/cholesterol/gamma-HCH transport system substrate-binding protein|nr:MlaD family protein [Bacteriovoracaceae bacterium]